MKTKIVLLLFVMFSDITLLNAKTNNQVFKSFKVDKSSLIDTTIYTSLFSWVWSDFQKANQNKYFDTLCINDIASFTFQLTETGKLNIKQYSKLFPQELKSFLDKSIESLNKLPLSKKPFVSRWLKSKYANKQMIQPILIQFFNSCEIKDISSMGFLSILTFPSKYKKYEDVLKDWDMIGYFNVEPFNGILLSPFTLSSDYYYR